MTGHARVHFQDQKHQAFLTKEQGLHHHLVNLAMQQAKKRIDKMESLVDNDEVVSTWSVHISKYGKLHLMKV